MHASIEMSEVSQTKNFNRIYLSGDLKPDQRMTFMQVVDVLRKVLDTSPLIFSYQM